MIRNARFSSVLSFLTFIVALSPSAYAGRTQEGGMASADAISHAPSEQKRSGEPSEQAPTCIVQSFGGGVVCQTNESSGPCESSEKSSKYCFFNGITELCLDRKPAHVRTD